MPSRDDWDDETPPPPPFADAPPPPPDVLPQGEVYDWYVRGLDLLESGNAAAAVTLLTHAANSEPESRSVREALARAQFDSGLYDEAVRELQLDHLDQPGRRLRAVRARPGRGEGR